MGLTCVPFSGTMNATEGATDLQDHERPEMKTATMKTPKQKWFRVYSTIDRGEDSTPRFFSTSLNDGGITRVEAEELAARARAFPETVEVTIEEVDSQD
jgi:hypothetical protein